MSASPFQQCDHNVMGSNPLCALPTKVTIDDGTGLALGNIPMWGTSLIDQYRKEKSSVVRDIFSHNKFLS